MLFRVFLVFLLVAAKSVNAAHPNYSAISISVNDGEILFAENPTKRIYLASVTKLMTLYLAFEALKDARVSLYDQVVASKRASIQPPKKVYLEAGERYTFKELLVAAAVFSANDAAFAIAEELGGTIEDFVYLMNQKASELGLKDTYYVDPSGFPGQSYSTAVDIINLARMLRENFPEYYSIFGNEMFAQNGKIYGNSNKLLPFFKGMDGLKTGYTNLSGFNLACSFKYKDNMIIAAIFGMPSATERDQRMREIMDYSVKKVLGKKNSKNNNGNITPEYETFLKDANLKTEKHGFYFHIINNIIDQNKEEISLSKTKQKSIINKTISEVSNFSELISHPIPLISVDEE